MDFNMIKNINRQRLSNQVTGQLIKIITSGSSKSGDKLPSETQLAQGFGVSRPVVREALRELATLGLIQIEQGKPATICKMSSQPITNILSLAVAQREEGLLEAVELRKTIETQIASKAAERITEEESDRLENALYKLKIVPADGIDEWVDADAEFHLLIAAISKNMLMFYLVEALRELLHESIRVVYSHKSLRDNNRAYQRHARIFEAIKAHDPVAAREAMKDHFNTSETISRMLLEKETTANY